ncbi:DUF934 domain-containing protein [Sinisalibacter aestuarii]|uniref:DUF934 domain-containing protein n=1 Tax=Sinisalibacter aestuarii TaxID=2949426 RepID=A0ABQ5LZB4_9RHOB|nr:DUF934 domain-containing protein [Sinisalibacter aestuarii]GKY89467.1 hypothetical protein STA1M1_33360 [Sinisalibacter aestuarii]
MTLIVTDTGFAPDDWPNGFHSLESAAAGAGCVECGIEIVPEDHIAAHRAEILAAPMIRVAVTGFADGRGFTLARALRLMGYTGRLRAGAGLIADQYAMARRAGFDEVEIDAALATRQPEEHWLFRADWRAYDHQSRLRG